MDFTNDPRIASTPVTGGPLAGQRIVVVDEVWLGGENVRISLP